MAQLPGHGGIDKPLIVAATQTALLQQLVHRDHPDGLFSIRRGAL
jgi:hypothetical protein